MKKILWFLLKIFTFNGKLLKNKKHKKPLEIKTELTTSKNTSVNVENIITSLGGKNNFALKTHSLNTITFQIENLELVKITDLKTNGAKGTMLSGNELKVIFGDDAKIIYDQIANLLN